MPVLYVDLDPDEEAGPDGRQALATAIFARTDVIGFERLEYDLTPDAIELGLDAALPAVFEHRGTIAESGRGERRQTAITDPSVRSRGLTCSIVGADRWLRRAG